jgi:hypothetical protein
MNTLYKTYIFSSSYCRSFVTDGNFKATHHKQKYDDIWLTDGEAFMTKKSRYEAHLAVAQESQSVSMIKKKQKIH